MKVVDPLRMALLPPRRELELPTVHGGNAVVVVEGFNDAQVIRDSVHAPVLYLGGTNMGRTHHARMLMDTVSHVAGGVIILPDPDGEGGRFRTTAAMHLTRPAWHAFLPVSCAVAGSATANHDFANAGIEHATPSDIVASLLQARLYRPKSGKDRIFDRPMLRSWGLVNPFDADAAGERIEHAALRREILCNALGLARMDGRRLLSALNMYSFTTSEVRAVGEVHVSKRRA
jgi:5S rRNA maturation endonuclease (ribonuclease M5)